MRFVDRHIGPTEADRQKMLAVVGQPSLDALIDNVVPSQIRMSTSLAIGQAQSEDELLEHLREIASKNTVVKSFIGCGYYGTITPPVVLRNILENPAWYTAYTPYQPEISQGRLEALITFQTAVTDLTGMDIANASMLDEATAAAEAMTLARRTSKAGDDAHFIVDVDVHPQTLAVIQTRAIPLGIGIKVERVTADTDFSQSFGVLVQYPSSTGEVRSLASIADMAHAHNVVVVAAADLLALTLIESPGAQGADICVGSSQRFGVPMAYGGPHAGYMAVRSGLERAMPGRLVGVSVDSHGNSAYRLALQTREQHIRREKATSNICTAQVLLAVMAGMYAVWHGPRGLRDIASRVHELASVLATSLSAKYALVHSNLFDTVTIDGNAAELVAKALSAGYNVRCVNDGQVSISIDETTRLSDVEKLCAAFGVEVVSADMPRFPADVARKTDFLTHPVFNSYHNETAMLRYLRALADKDLALDRTMIPLGSCTMKLNATTEMIPITWPEFASLHPFAPADQAKGTRELIKRLESWLVEVTGYDAVSLQPNAGSQGEFAGLLAIREYHLSRGDAQRNICLIPSSAHGTNAASAVMAGMKVVVVACDAMGNVDVDDLKSKIEEHRETLAALMVTYPSTHGVFEEAITQICAAVHDAGGQVYVDGANLNALVGLAQPGRFGADVSHLNLHKTFAIPHGGGGPGVGPVGVRAHLAPFLPNHPLDDGAGPQTGPGPVSAAPFGSAGILPISYAYIALLGSDGLLAATKNAILSANYIAQRLGDAYPILYAGSHGYVAHECIIDVRPITKETGVTVDDIAKRLMDYGFHAPTMSFPVAGTLMIEPTESEDLTELDRFISAMLSIRQEIQDIADGTIAVESSALRHAPHTAASLVGEWDRAYDRSVAVFPAGVSGQFSRTGKYWPPVGRIDGAHGDRNLVCACPPMESYA